MKTYQEYAAEFGTVNLDDGEEIALMQQAYIDHDYHSFEEVDFYRASAISQCGNVEFNVRWEITNAECGDESHACDWETYTIF